MPIGGAARHSYCLGGSNPQPWRCAFGQTTGGSETDSVAEGKYKGPAPTTRAKYRNSSPDQPISTTFFIVPPFALMRLRKLRGDA
jgi:hypothetical protein